MLTQEDLYNAARDVEARIYRDLPSSNSRHFKADRAVGQVLDTVMRAMGLRDGTRVTLRENDGPLIEDGSRR